MRRAALLAAIAVLAGCGSTAPTAYSVVDSYLTAIGEGDYSGACGLLDHHARASMRPSCTALFARCLANKAVALARDQTQQLYADIKLSSHGNTAVADVSGTAVARTVKKVTLAEQSGNWRVASAGSAFRHCRR
jgi:hypothetical protein